MSDPTPVNINSAYDQLEIVKTGNSTFSTATLSNPGAGNFSSTEVINTVPHNLGFTPAILAFVQQGTSWFQTPSNSFSGLTTTASWIVYQVEVDDVNIYFLTDIITYGLGASAPTQNVKYFLMRSKASS